MGGRFVASCPAVGSAFLAVFPGGMRFCLSGPGDFWALHARLGRVLSSFPREPLAAGRLWGQRGQVLPFAIPWFAGQGNGVTHWPAPVTHYQVLQSSIPSCPPASWMTWSETRWLRQSGCARGLGVLQSSTPTRPFEGGAQRTVERSHM